MRKYISCQAAQRTQLMMLPHAMQVNEGLSSCNLVATNQLIRNCTDTLRCYVTTVMRVLHSGRKYPPPDKTPYVVPPPPFCCRRTEPSGEFFENCMLLVLLTLSDPRGGVLTLTDPRTASEKGVMTWRVVGHGLVGHLT